LRWDAEERKILVWDGIVCSPIEAGGLGIKNMGRFNTDKLEKQKWRLEM